MPPSNKQHGCELAKITSDGRSLGLRKPNGGVVTRPVICRKTEIFRARIILFTNCCWPPHFIPYALLIYFGWRIEGGDATVSKEKIITESRMGDQSKRHSSSGKGTGRQLVVLSVGSQGPPASQSGILKSGSEQETFTSGMRIKITGNNQSIFIDFVADVDDGLASVSVSSTSIIFSSVSRSLCCFPTILHIHKQSPFGTPVPGLHEFLYSIFYVLWLGSCFTSSFLPPYHHPLNSSIHLTTTNSRETHSLIPIFLIFILYHPQSACRSLSLPLHSTASTSTPTQNPRSVVGCCYCRSILC